MDGCHAHLVSPLQLADRLIQLAAEADQAGFAAAATTLLALVYAVLVYAVLAYVVLDGGAGRG